MRGIGGRVTGAGKGLGRAVAEKLHGFGATVIALSRTKSDLDTLEAKLPGLITLHCDLSDWQKTRQAVESVLPIHHLVNNAATVATATFLNITEDELIRSFSVNLNAVVNVSQIVATDMIARRQGGSIVNVSGISSKMHIPNIATCSATKGALNTLTKSMGTELAPYNIRVNVVQPTIFLSTLSARVLSKTDDDILARHPIGRYPDCDQIADTILFLLSDLSTMMVGSEVLVDGGFLSN